MTEARTFPGQMLRAAARTDPGRVRVNNEDLPLLDAARGIFGVIDGIGGQAGGEIAAATARDVILQRLARPLGTPAERVREAIAIANNEIHRRAEQSNELRGMACVVTLALVTDGFVTIGHVGDTRLYKIRPGSVRKLTRDHSPVGEREDAGELSEVDAMRHPRRHEVFRDVGSISRDKDEQEFVDVVHERLERDCAILLCSDGLSDMVPGTAIAHIVRQHAGEPERVVDALVAAANGAGGKDNITVVYAEMPDFAHAIAGNGDALAPTEPLAGISKAPAATTSPVETPRPPGLLDRAARSIVQSRITWFAVGTLAGVVGALWLMLSMARTQLPSSQTLVVDADGSTAYATIGAALAAARAGDVVRVDPGTYREVVVLRDGIDLIARMPGTVTLTRPAGMHPGVPTLAITGALHARVSGIRIETAGDTPIEIGVYITAPAATLDLLEIAGPIRQAIVLSSTSSVTMTGTRISVAGSVVTVPDGVRATFTNNIIVRSAPGTGPAISAAPNAQVTLRGNVFSGYAEIISGVSDARRRELLSPNIVVPPPAEGRAPSGRGRSPRGQ